MLSLKEVLTIRILIVNITDPNPTLLVKSYKLILQAAGEVAELDFISSSLVR